MATSTKYLDLDGLTAYDANIKNTMVGKDLAGKEVSISNTETAAASDGAEIFNDYRDRTYDSNGDASKGNIAIGSYSHAEGISTSSLGDYSHAEGAGNIAKGMSSHVEGASNKADGQNSHAEGFLTAATNTNSHAEGSVTQASGANSHAEGNSTRAIGSQSHAEGASTTANKEYSHAEGYHTYADGQSAHAEGNNTTASGGNSHAEGASTIASGVSSHAEGAGCKAIGSYSHAEGTGTTANGNYSHAEGAGATANGHYSHAEGGGTTATGLQSHAEGAATRAIADNSHAEGNTTETHGNAAHAEGTNTYARGTNSHTEGLLTTAYGDNSHAEGNGTEAYGINTHVEGAYNLSGASVSNTNRGQYLHIAGNGTNSSNRSNAHTLDWNGNAEYQGDVKANACGGTNPVSLVEVNDRVTVLESKPDIKEYSTTPQRIGTWIDGTPVWRVAIYREVQNFTVDEINDRYINISGDLMIKDMNKAFILNRDATLFSSVPCMIDDVPADFSSANSKYCLSFSVSNLGNYDGVYGWAEFVTPESNLVSGTSATSYDAATETLSVPDTSYDAVNEELTVPEATIQAENMTI